MWWVRCVASLIGRTGGRENDIAGFLLWNKLQKGEHLSGNLAFEKALNAMRIGEQHRRAGHREKSCGRPAPAIGRSPRRAERTDFAGERIGAITGVVFFCPAAHDDLTFCL
jgi:hypothetical protein